MDETTQGTAQQDPAQQDPAQQGARGVWWLVIAGMLTSAGDTWLVCQRFLLSPQVSLLRVVLMGAGMVVFPAATAMALCWVLWKLRGDFRRKGGLPFRRVVLACGAAWLLIPAIGVLLIVNSAWALLLTVGAAVVSAPAIRRLTPGPDFSGALGGQEPMRFGLLPSSNSGIWIALAIAAGLEGAAIPLAKGSLFLTGLLLTSAVSVLLWQWTSTSPRAMQERGGGSAKLLVALVLAIVVMTTVLLARMEGGFGGYGGTAKRGGKGQNEAAERGQTRNVAADLGYKGIILWPVPKKKEIVAPAPMSFSLQAGMSRKPVVIPFDGAYWYYQPPHRDPGKNAHQDHGEPTGVNIRSTGFSPLIMEAHQSLGSSIDLSCCGALEMEIKNGDNLPGKIVMAVVLTDTHRSSQPSLALSGQTVVSSEPGHFFIKSSPVEEKLRFSIPPRREIEKFDEITVIYFPPPDRAIVGLKVAIEQFELMPR
jgi:hypothetical protein